MADQPRLSKQQEREQRILDAAADLILRWGYDKTAMDDISEKSGVAKGTIYLHWKTREELFEALLQRESQALMVDFKQGIQEDPSGATLRGIYKQAALALIRRPLLKAFLLGDRGIIGKLARVEHNRPFYDRRLSGFYVYLEFLRAHGLVRSDIDFASQLYTVSAIFVGFFTIGPWIPDRLQLPDEEIADLIGESIHRTLETGREVSPEEQRELVAAFIAYLDETQKQTELQLQSSLDV